jgi:hypothetical protein
MKDDGTHVYNSLILASSEAAATRALEIARPGAVITLWRPKRGRSKTVAVEKSEPVQVGNQNEAKT